MSKKICQHCNYCRPYCSNSKSDNFMEGVKPDDTCAVFVKRGSKAPLAMRAANRALAGILARRDAGKGEWRDA